MASSVWITLCRKTSCRSGRQAPTSLLQLFGPRVELHLFYNAVVFAPMMVAVIVHMRPSSADRIAMRCGCARVSVAVV